MFFLGFFREDVGSNSVLQPRTQTYMADPLINYLDGRRAMDGINPHKGAGPVGLFPKVLNALTPTLPPYLHECLTFDSKLPRSLKIGDVQ